MNIAEWIKGQIINIAPWIIEKFILVISSKVIQSLLALLAISFSAAFAILSLFDTGDAVASWVILGYAAMALYIAGFIGILILIYTAYLVVFTKS